MKRVFVVLMLVLMLCGCGSVRYVPVEHVRTDTVFRSNVLRDSVFLHDSVFVHAWQAGDTVFVDRERWCVKYVERVVHDTLYRCSVDSVAVPYPVEKELTWWARKKIEFGELAVFVFAGLLCFLFVRFKFK